MIAIAADKQLHFSLSALSVLVGVATGMDVVTSALLTAAAGVGRELYNRRTTGFSWGDLAADAAGIALGAGLALAIGGRCA